MSAPWHDPALINRLTSKIQRRIDSALAPAGMVCCESSELNRALSREVAANPRCPLGPFPDDALVEKAFDKACDKLIETLLKSDFTFYTPLVALSADAPPNIGWILYFEVARDRLPRPRKPRTKRHSYAVEWR